MAVTTEIDYVSTAAAASDIAFISNGIERVNGIDDNTEVEIQVGGHDSSKVETVGNIVKGNLKVAEIHISNIVVVVIQAEMDIRNIVNIDVLIEDHNT